MHTEADNLSKEEASFGLSIGSVNYHVILDREEVEEPTSPYNQEAFSFLSIG